MYVTKSGPVLAFGRQTARRPSRTRPHMRSTAAAHHHSAPKSGPHLLDITLQNSKQLA